ncbi:MAG: cell division ATP-binding protein FtsE [Eubacteriales bacterium]|nr:cell division ATP-binding protein FtsE [Bacillota bacterium]MBV1728441.1 cell division ATP-binding protein FtsE [Desulforudis sp.]MDZ4043998.1 cell division ATP-binding protein FtsE [Eubacteriales bacterium]MBU4533054.1 cell division ATP-binding protein FtsE [Bacillota bacterium]MBU4554727.1 cell division ATP-binding protein FtsE [Bacillota bacterium]
MIQFYNVTKLYPNGAKAINDLSLRIKQGDFAFLVGPSGAGKSTIAKLIFREEKPTAGQIFFNGRNALRFRGREVVAMRRKIGMVFQDFRLLSQKTAYENVAFALEVTGVSRWEVRKRVPEVLRQVGLEDKMDRFPAQLSGGEQQRVCVARAIVKNPVLILADEPTGNLDPETSRELMELFLEINQSGTTIVIATHAWDIVNELKKRVIALESGRIVRDEEQGSYGYGVS